MKKIKSAIIFTLAAIMVCFSVFAAACKDETPIAHTHELTAVAEKAATCTEDGYEAYWKCEGCDKLFSDAEGKNEITAPVTVKAKGHTGGTATCTQKATCSVCGEEYGELVAHVYDKEVEEEKYLKSAATCMSPAVYYKSCDCGAKGTETFTSGNVLAHSYTVLQHDASDHWYKCANCDATDEKQAHTGGTATCTQKATCSVCGEEYGELVCTEPCPECGGCLDADCTEEACATKCGANKTAHVYEAENATLEDGLAYYGKMFVQSGETRSWIANLNYNTGATVTFDVYSSVSTTASLVVTINRRKAETIFTNVFGVFVNGTDIGSRPSDVPAYEEQYDESSFIDLNIGCVQLVEGKNTIAFRVLGTGEYSGYNFDKITLLCDDITAAPHLCESVCPTCGKCMDLNCTEADCAEKCGDGKPVTRFEVEDAVLVDGADSLSEMTDFSYTDMTYVGNVNQNYGATITFNVNATQDTTATLVVRLNRREIETVFTDLIGVTVNGEKIERDTIVPFIAKDSQWSAEAFTEISLGCIPLKSGANEIKFTVQTENNVNGYNFDYIELRGEHIEPPAHICESACPVCGGCLDLNCAHAECADKCKGGDVATVFEAEEGELVNGTTIWGDISIGTMGDRKYVQSMNGNQGSKVIFTIMSDEARTVTLTVTSNMRSRETVYTELYGISVNGGANLATGTVVPKTEVQYQDAGFREFNLGCIELQAGENKIVFEVLGTGECSGYNIDKITLYSDSALTAEA